MVVGNQCRMRRMFGDVMCWLGLGGHELAANQGTIRAPARAEVRVEPAK